MLEFALEPLNHFAKRLERDVRIAQRCRAILVTGQCADELHGDVLCLEISNIGVAAAVRGAVSDAGELLHGTFVAIAKLLHRVQTVFA